MQLKRIIKIALLSNNIHTLIIYIYIYPLSGSRLIWIYLRCYSRRVVPYQVQPLSTPIFLSSKISFQPFFILHPFIANLDSLIHAPKTGDKRFDTEFIIIYREREDNRGAEARWGEGERYRGEITYSRRWIFKGIGISRATLSRCRLPCDGRQRVQRV